MEECLAEGIKKHGHNIVNLELITSPIKPSDDSDEDVPVVIENNLIISYMSWKLAEDYCGKLQSLAVPFSTNKAWIKTVTGILKANPFMNAITIYEQLPISEPSAAPWFVCESSSRKRALLALVKAAPPRTQFTLKLSSTYSFELRPEFYGINEIEIRLKQVLSIVGSPVSEVEGYSSFALPIGSSHPTSTYHSSKTKGWVTTSDRNI